MPQRHLPPATDIPSPRSLPRRALLAAAAAAVPTGAVVMNSAPALADPSATEGGTGIVDLPLAEAEQVDVDGVLVRDLPEQPGTMVGTTWPDDSVAPTVHARGLAEDGSWTPWFELETAMDPDTGEAVAATEVAWLGTVSALQIRAESEGVDVTDVVTAHVVTTSETTADDEVDQYSGPGTSTARSQQSQSLSTMSASAAANPTTPSLASDAPAFVSRASWGADEGSTGETYGRDALKAVVIHHTAGSNNYSSGQSAGIVRGIHSYHTRTLGWADIGYNVLVDKYGRIFEGRSGGLHRNIQGAHASGFNRGSFGISVMGDYTSTSVSSAARTAVSRLAGWKLLSTFQQSVWGGATWTSIGSGTRFPEGSTRSLPKIMGHRDVNYTACPGNRLYSQFDWIRRDAQSRMDSGWKHHLTAFKAAGGSKTLGTVTHSAYSTGSYWVTRLTKGLVIHRSGSAAKGYVSDFSQEWQQSWGLPKRAPFTAGGQRLQTFQNGAVVVQHGRPVFHDSRFIDVPPKMMFRAEIEELASRGITTGWGDGTYRPLADIQRDAMVVFVYRALGSPAFTPPKTSPFKDMPPSRRYYKEITWAHAKGITTGWSDGTFRPTAPVERGAVAAFLYRASGATATSTSNSFKDVPSNHKFAKEITWLAKTGITNGWSDGTFRPLDPIARDAMAAFMIRWK